MAIRTYEKNNQKLYEVYVNGFNSRGERVQRKGREIESIRKARAIEFELRKELSLLKEEKVPYQFGQWFEVCLENMKMVHQPSTVWNYEKQLGKWILPHWKYLDLTEIKKSDVFEIIFKKMDEKTSAFTKKGVLKMVRRIFQMAVEDGHLDRNPCTGIQVKVPEVDQKVLTNSEVEIFLKEARITNHRFYEIWAMALMTGMRSGELFALTWNDIDLDAKTISVNKQWTSKNGFGPTKTQRNRIVPISDDLLQFLKELKMKRVVESNFVLPRLPEWEIGAQAQVTKDFCVSIGVTPIKFHDLRATFITNLLARGEALARVMAVVGHTQLKTTNGYLRKAGVDVQGTTNKLGYRLPEDVHLAQILAFKPKQG